MNRVQAAQELRKAIQLFLRTLTEEEDILAVPSVFPAYAVGVRYKTEDIFSYGVNTVGDPQLYQVLQDHTSSEAWTPDTASGLYKKIGVSEDGTPVWTQPLGASDAYRLGDIVMHKETKYRSTVDHNTWEPGVYGWEVVAA